MLWWSSWLFNERISNAAGHMKVSYVSKVNKLAVRAVLVLLFIVGSEKNLSCRWSSYLQLVSVSYLFSHSFESK